MLSSIFSKSKLLKYSSTFVVFIYVIISISSVYAAPSSDLWQHWKTHDLNSKQTIDFTPWDQLLEKYLVINHPSGINRFRYRNVSEEDYKRLKEYLELLQDIKVSSLNKKEQKRGLEL